MLKFNPLRALKPPLILSYGVALVSVIAVLIIAWWIESVWQSVPHVSLFLCAVMFSAWFGGTRPGLLALVFSVLAFNYYFLPPIYSLALAKDLPRLVFFALSGLFVVSLTAAQRSAAESLRDARDELHRTVQELKRTNEVLQAENAERKRAEDALHHAQSELAHVTRLTTLGELSASIAHEVNQPLTAVITNANACLRWLAGDSPNLEEAREAGRRIIRDGNRASDVIARIRALVQKTDTEKVRLDINHTVQEVVMLMQNEAVRKGVALRMDLAADVPPVLGDRVQLQQVILNLVMNGIEAMASVANRPRELCIRARRHESDRVLVTVQDSGIGIDPQNLEKIFDTFYTTKSQGLGMGLAIGRSIVENHGGRLWAVPNDGPGMTFEFALPVDAVGPTTETVQVVEKQGD